MKSTHEARTLNQLLFKELKALKLLLHKLILAWCHRLFGGFFSAVFHKLFLVLGNKGWSFFSQEGI